MAGGNSLRMGFPKAMLTKEREPVLRLMAEALKRCGWTLSSVVVATEDLAEWVHWTLDRPLVIVNDRPERGPISSLRLALNSLPAGAPGLLIWPVDHPVIKDGTLLSIQRAANAVNAVVPLFAGRRGHPVWWGRQTFRHLKSRIANGGARKVLYLPAVNVCEVEVDDPGVLVNIDTSEDAERYGLQGASE